MDKSKLIPVVIPAYEPDERFVELARSIDKSSIDSVIVVDDGSDEVYSKFFSEVRRILGDRCVFLSHPTNKGKGAALKTAFSYVIENYPDALGVVTADSDGQHDIDSIKKLQNAIISNSGDLILGVRSFNGKDIPWKSKFGNRITRIVFRLATGVDVSDTQTGLRGIPFAFLKDLLKIKYDRFEYEMNMLIDCVTRYHIVEIPIETIYESKDNHQTHFNPFLDSIKIYKVLLGKTIKRK